MSDPKSDCTTLINVVLPFAEQTLARYGEFYPFGSAMRADGQILAVASHDGNETPASTDVIQLLKEGFVVGAKNGELKATALAYDVRVKLPSTGERSDAIAVSLNHRDDYSSSSFLTRWQTDDQSSVSHTLNKARRICFFQDRFNGRAYARPFRIS